MPRDAESSRFTLADILPGAHTAVRTCMNVQPAERVFILTDEVTALVGEALAQAAQAAGAGVALHRLEEFAPRPLRVVPPQLIETVRSFAPHVTFYAASGQPGEVTFRMALRPLLLASNPTGVRHAHMIGITPLLMTQGMRVDYAHIYTITMRLAELLRPARTMRVTNPKGTDFRITLSPELRWVPCHGLYHQPGMWGNLPEGEIYTSPAAAAGVLVVDELGDHFSAKYGVLAHPVTLRVTDSRVTDVECADRGLQAEVEAYLQGAENADRVGEVAIGCNIGLQGPVGNLLQDEKLPGVHVAFGNPYPETTGAQWTSTLHMDVIPIACTIEVDGRQIMHDGIFVPELTAA